MSDLISRQQAIDIVRNRVKRFTTACVLAVTEIEQLPSAHPTFTEAEIQRMQELDSAQIRKAYEVGYEEGKKERKIGHWILSDDRDWKTCSECGADVDVSMGIGVYVDNDEVSEMCFCPNCGSDMRGESDG